MKKILALRILRHIPLNLVNCRSCCYGPVGIQRTRLTSGLQIVGAENAGALMAACSVLYQAGSRFESMNDCGATHFLRAASSASGKEHTKFMKSHVLSQYGAAITCTSDRQHVTYTLRCLPAHFPRLQRYLRDACANAAFYNWEIDDLRGVVKYSLQCIHPQQRVMDLLQKACWRGPLSNSVFCEPERINSITGDILIDYANYVLNTDNCTVAGYGLPFDQVIDFGESLNYYRDKPTDRFYCSNSCPRGGCEMEDLGPVSSTWIALGVPGCNTLDLGTLLTYNIVAAACGIGHNEMSEHPEDRVPSSPLGIMAGNDFHTEYKAFNISYSDHGVFGILAKTRPCSAWSVTKSAAEFLAHVDELNFEQIAIGKERLKLSLAVAEEDCVSISEGLAMQQSYCIEIDDIHSLLKIIDCISPASVCAAAKCLSKNRCLMAVAAVGDISLVPNEKELIQSII